MAVHYPDDAFGSVAPADVAGFIAVAPCRVAGMRWLLVLLFLLLCIGFCKRELLSQRKIHRIFSGGWDKGFDDDVRCVRDGL